MKNTFLLWFWNIIRPSAFLHWFTRIPYPFYRTSTSPGAGVRWKLVAPLYKYYLILIIITDSWLSYRSKQRFRLVHSSHWSIYRTGGGRQTCRIFIILHVETDRVRILKMDAQKRFSKKLSFFVKFFLRHPKPPPYIRNYLTYDQERRRIYDSTYNAIVTDKNIR